MILAELGTDTPVDVAGHDVDFVPERDVWSCDVELSPGSAYRPLVRLALARVQSHAVPGAELSPVVLLDWTQLAPDRAAMVTHDPVVPGLVHATITGTTYRGIAVAQAGGRVELVIQQRYDPLAEDLGWVDLQQFDFGQPEIASDTTLLWRGSFKVPTDPGRGPFRIVVQEVEDWPSDCPGL